jgi:hypothetical protein
MAGFIPPVVLELKAKATELFATIDEVNKSVDDMAGKTMTSGEKLKAGFSQHSGAIALAGAGVIGAFAGVTVEAAAAAETVDAQLKVAIGNAGGSMEEMEPKIQGLDTQFQKLGFTNEETNTSLSTMTTALGDPAKAMDVMGVAADLARTKHIGLNDAALKVAQAMEGNTKPLKQLGIDLPIHAANAAKVADAQQKLADAQQGVNDVLAKFPDAADPASAAHDKYLAATQKVDSAQHNLNEKQSAGDEILKGLTDRVKGAGDAFGDTLQGKLDATKAGFEGIAAQLGQALLPVIKLVVDGLTGFTDWAQKNPVLFNILVGVVGALTVAITVMAGAVWIMNSAIWANTVALLANPMTWIIVAIIAAVAGLIAIIVLLVTYWDVISKVLTDGFNNVMSFFKTVFDAIGKWWGDLWTGIGKFFTDWWNGYVKMIKDQFNALVSFFLTIGKAIGDWWTGLWNGIIGFFTTAFNAYVAGVKLIFNGIVSFFMTIGSAISSWWNGLWTGIISFFTNIFNGIGDFVSGIFKGIVNGIIGAINWMLTPINAVIDGINGALDGIKTVSGGAISLHIDHLANLPSLDVGGTIPGAYGQAVPMIGHGGEYVLSNDMLAGRTPVPSQIAQAVGGKHSQQVINVNVETNASPTQIASSVGWLLRQMG